MKLVKKEIMSAKEILHELFPNCKVSGREDMIDYSPSQLRNHLEETLNDWKSKEWDGSDDYHTPTWIDFTNWTYDCGFRIHRDRITFWARYSTTRDYITTNKYNEWIVFTA